jgi:hypothetical protein
MRNNASITTLEVMRISALARQRSRKYVKELVEEKTVERGEQSKASIE